MPLPLMPLRLMPLPLHARRSSHVLRKLSVGPSARDGAEQAAECERSADDAQRDNRSFFTERRSENGRTA